MAFTQDTFNPVAPNSSNGPRFWSYETSDPIDDVLAIGYFNDKKFQLNRYDFIYVAAEDQQHIVCYLSETEPSRTVSPTIPKEVLVGFSFDDQEPTALDTPIQVSYGPAQGTIDDDVMIDANGRITINKSGFYGALFTYNFGRQGSSGGVANMFLRGVINDNQLGNPLATLIDNPSIVIPEQFEVQGVFLAGTTIDTEFYRDSSGVNEGGLYIDFSSIGWGTSPSTRVRLSKLFEIN